MPIKINHVKSRYMNTIPDWALKYKTRGVYIRNVGNNYYACRTRSKWIKEEKKTKTLPPEYLGVVTRNGIVRKDQVMGIRCHERSFVDLDTMLTSPIIFSMSSSLNSWALSLLDSMFFSFLSYSALNA